MFDAADALVLRLLKVPAQPEPPAGAPESVRVFLAARNFYRVNLFRWGLRQAATLIPIILVISLKPELILDLTTRFIPDALGQHAGTLVGRLVIGFIHLAELLAVAGLAFQLPFSYFLVRLDYRMRWYIVTDRSLRIRYGLLHVREMTMTFANIQQITVRQGPLQRLLGIADLKVRSAGGGDGGDLDDEPAHVEEGQGESMHIGYFRGVDNAEEIRDLIGQRLRQLRDTGLGDPDELAHAPPAERPESPNPLLAAARDLLREARALRERVTSGQ